MGKWRLSSRAIATRQLALSCLHPNITEALFFVPGTADIPNGPEPATVTGFGAVFTDVDQPDGSGPGQKKGNRGASTLMDHDGKLIFSSFVPASPAMGACPSSASCLTTRASRGSGSQPATLPRGRMMMAHYASPHETEKIVRLAPNSETTGWSGHPLQSFAAGALINASSCILSDSKLNATESPKLFATEKKSRDIRVLLLE
jgi:hypothetical protein